MFNDPLSLEQCERLVRHLAMTTFPFQCAHGRLVFSICLWGCDDLFASFFQTFPCSFDRCEHRVRQADTSIGLDKVKHNLETFITLQVS
jgi:hypothetical protein